VRTIGARQIGAVGHDVQLIAPIYVKPVVGAEQGIAALTEQSRRWNESCANGRAPMTPPSD
jgi:hypothetical protein